MDEYKGKKVVYVDERHHQVDEDIEDIEDIEDEVA